MLIHGYSNIWIYSQSQHFMFHNHYIIVIWWSKIYSFQSNMHSVIYLNKRIETVNKLMEDHKKGSVSESPCIPFYASKVTKFKCRFKIKEKNGFQQTLVLKW